MKKKLCIFGGLLLLIAAGVCVLLFWKKPLPPVTARLVTATDLHYLSPALTDHGEYFRLVLENGDGKAMEHCEEITDAFVEQVISTPPDALLLSGDLTFNGARKSHEALIEKLSKIKEAGIPVLAIPGNHDLENRNAASFQGDHYTLVDSVTAAEFSELYSAFGFEDALSRDETSLSYVFQITPQLRALMIDVNSPGCGGAVKEETLRWAEEQLILAARQGSRVVAISHQNLIAHSDLFDFGYAIHNGSKLLELYEKYGVLCNLSGHMHIQHTVKSQAGLWDIATSSLLMWPLQYGELSLEGKTAHYRAIPVESPFSDYAYDYHWQHCAQLTADENGKADPELGRFFADINTAYFSGHVTQDLWDDTLYQALQTEGGFTAQYLTSIYEDGFQNHREFSFDF